MTHTVITTGHTQKGMKTKSATMPRASLLDARSLAFGVVRNR